MLLFGRPSQPHGTKPTIDAQELHRRVTRQDKRIQRLLQGHSTWAADTEERGMNTIVMDHIAQGASEWDARMVRFATDDWARPIDRGGQGAVFEGRAGNYSFAVKVDREGLLAEADDTTSDSSRQRRTGSQPRGELLLLREGRIIESLKHPYVVELLGTCSGEAGAAVLLSRAYAWESRCYATSRRCHAILGLPRHLVAELGLTCLVMKYARGGKRLRQQHESWQGTDRAIHQLLYKPVSRQPHASSGRGAQGRGPGGRDGREAPALAVVGGPPAHRRPAGMRHPRPPRARGAASRPQAGEHAAGLLRDGPLHPPHRLWYVTLVQVRHTLARDASREKA